MHAGEDAFPAMLSGFGMTDIVIKFVSSICVEKFIKLYLIRRKKTFLFGFNFCFIKYSGITCRLTDSDGKTNFCTTSLLLSLSILKIQCVCLVFVIQHF